MAQLTIQWSSSQLVRLFFGGQGGFFVMTTQGQGTLLANAYGSIKKN